jgi:methionyl-tRNA formyltransferase
MTLRLAFMGTPDFAVPALAALIEHGHDLRAVYTQPARPKGRGLAFEPSPVAKLAASHRIEVRTPQSLKGEAAQRAFAELHLDAAVVVAYGLLLPKAILDSPRLGCFNLHASLLPRWRGAAPIQRAIMAGDRETGAMVMRMEEGLDTGPVLSEERTAIGRKTFGDLHDQLTSLGAGLMVRTLAAIERGNSTGHSQHNIGATYARKIENAETRIDWSRPVDEVDCLIRGLSPYPGAWCEYRNERLKVLYAEPVDAAGAPGEILDDRLTVACRTGALRLTRLQRAGRAPMKAEDLLRGYGISAGARLG